MFDNSKSHFILHLSSLKSICPLLPTLSAFNDQTLSLSNVRFVILMHYKEYLSAGDDAKLLLAMLPLNNAKLYIFGRKGDWQAFEEELTLDPVHTLTLWPGEGALTIDQYLSELPNSSSWRQVSTSCSSSIDITRNGDHPVLRVVVLDGVFSHARTMFKTMRQRLSDRNLFPKFVALHPDTLSIYHRAQKNYGNASAQTVVKSNNPKALHICTVEACALLLREVFSTSRSKSGLLSVAAVEDAVNRVAESLVQAVRVNNDALVHCVDVRPVSGVPTSNSSGAAKRSQRKREAREKRATSAQTISK